MTATLSLPGDRDAITADFVPGSASVISVAQVGRPSISHCTAVGKVMLAYGPRGIDALELPLQRLTEATITDPARLAAQLETVREHGFAIAVGEREADLNAAAAPVFDARGLAAIIGLQGPAARLTRERLAEVSGPVVDAARRASAAMGAG